MIKKILLFLYQLWKRTNDSEAKYIVLAAGVLCFAAECIAHPNAAINTFMIHVIDSFASFLPSTPVNFTISGLLLSFASSNPAVGMGMISEILATVLPMFALYLVVKLYKFLPFT